MQFLYDILAKALMELYILTGNFGLAIIAIATLGESVGGGTQSTSSGSAGSNTGTYSQKKLPYFSFPS